MPHTRGNEIRELFNNMTYNEVSTINVDEAINELIQKHGISEDKTIAINDTKEVANRLLEVAEMIEKDRSALIHIFSKRVPIAVEVPENDIDLLINFVKYYATLINHNNLLWLQVNIDGGTWPQNAISSVYHTISTIIQNSHIQSYLKHISFGPRVILGGDSTIDTAMIVMADADLYSAVHTLTSKIVGKTDYLDRPLWYLKKIWIQEPVKDKFIDLIEELHIKDDTPSIKSMLQSFRNKNELLQELEKKVHIKAAAIWSKDVVTAKNLANAANRLFLIWINSYGKIGPGILLPWVDVEHHNNAQQNNEKLILTKRTDAKLIRDLFYDGNFQEPINGYWKDEEDTLWACAEWEDIEKCVASAEAGFKKWRSLPLSQRQKCFHRLADRLRAYGNSHLQSIVRFTAEWPLLYGSSLLKIQDGAVEITTTREAKGIIVIACDDLNELVRRIVCAAVAGNCVIVVDDRIGPQPTLSGIQQFCDFLAVCGFPPGVINSLSFNDIPNAFTQLSKFRSVAVICADFYTVPNNAVVVKNFASYWVNTAYLFECCAEKLYAQFTRPKSVWLPLK